MYIEVYLENGQCIGKVKIETADINEMIKSVDEKFGKDNWNNFRVNNDNV